MIIGQPDGQDILSEIIYADADSVVPPESACPTRSQTAAIMLIILLYVLHSELIPIFVFPRFQYIAGFVLTIQK